MDEDHTVLIWLDGDVKRVKKSVGLPLVKSGEATWATKWDLWRFENPQFFQRKTS